MRELGLTPASVLPFEATVNHTDVCGGKDRKVAGESNQLDSFRLGEMSEFVAANRDERRATR